MATSFNLNRVKYTLILFMLLATAVISAQTKDRRQELKIRGMMTEFSVSPNEKVWFVGNQGYAYCTNSLDSSWYQRDAITQQNGLVNLSNDLTKVSFFNSDTAILTGRIDTDKQNIWNGIYFTANGGKSWKLINMGELNGAEKTTVDKSGNAWLASFGGKLNYSRDFGQTWQKVNSPNLALRTHLTGFFMRNDHLGAIATANNDIYLSTDNWSTYKKIATPLDNGHFPFASQFAQGYIKKLVIWKNYIIVDQDQEIFYSDIDTISWRSFPVKIKAFEPDKESDNLFAVTDSLKVVSFINPTEFKKISDRHLYRVPNDMKVVNHTLFLLCGYTDIYKINEASFERYIPYTKENDISTPHRIKQGKHLSWGFNYNTGQVYVTENNKQDWYRENTFDFNIHSLKVIDDSTVFLWDGVKTNYIYSSHDRSVKTFVPELPLAEFVVSSIKSFSINAFYQGCSRRRLHTAVYERKKDSIFHCTFSSVKPYSAKYRENKTYTFSNSVSVNPLTSALQAINDKPAAMPLIKEFQISKTDQQKYMKRVNRIAKYQAKESYHSRPGVNKKLYKLVPTALDTINPSLVTKILEQETYNSFGSSDTFIFTIVNQNNDTLKFHRMFSRESVPANTPWKCEYKGLTFTCYGVALSRFVNSCIPNNFADKIVFDNSLLLLQIADDLYGTNLKMPSKE